MIAPMALAALLPLLSAPLALAQEMGKFTLNASIPETPSLTSGCIILAQLTLDTTPPVIQAMQPICPSSAAQPSDPSTGATVHWPIASTNGQGQGAASAMAIYSQISHAADRTDIYMAQAGCVMRVEPGTVQYLLRRSLTWNNGMQQLWDNDAVGFIADEGYVTLHCQGDPELLPSSLWFPDPYLAGADDAAWKVPIPLAPIGSTPPDPTTSLAQPTESTAETSTATEAGGIETDTTADLATSSTSSLAADPAESRTETASSTAQGSATSSVIPVDSVTDTGAAGTATSSDGGQTSSAVESTSSLAHVTESSSAAMSPTSSAAPTSAVEVSQSSTAPVSQTASVAPTSSASSATVAHPSSSAAATVSTEVGGIELTSTSASTATSTVRVTVTATGMATSSTCVPVTVTVVSTVTGETTGTVRRYEGRRRQN